MLSDCLNCLTDEQFAWLALQLQSTANKIKLTFCGKQLPLIAHFFSFFFFALWYSSFCCISLFTLFTFYSLNLFPNNDNKKTNEMLPKAVLQFVQVCLKLFKFNKMDGKQSCCHICFYSCICINVFLC